MSEVTRPDRSDPAISFASHRGLSSGPIHSALRDSIDRRRRRQASSRTRGRGSEHVRCTLGLSGKSKAGDRGPESACLGSRQTVPSIRVDLRRVVKRRRSCSLRDYCFAVSGTHHSPSTPGLADTHSAEVCPPRKVGRAGTVSARQNQEPFGAGMRLAAVNRRRDSGNRATGGRAMGSGS